MREADWNRVVAVARGHVSDAARKVIARIITGDLASGDDEWREGSYLPIAATPADVAARAALVRESGDVRQGFPGARRVEDLSDV